MSEMICGSLCKNNHNSQLVLFEIKNYNLYYGGAKWTI